MTAFLFFHGLRPVLTRRQGHSRGCYPEKVLRILLVALAEKADAFSPSCLRSPGVRVLAHCGAAKPAAGRTGHWAVLQLPGPGGATYGRPVDWLTVGRRTA